MKIFFLFLNDYFLYLEIVFAALLFLELKTMFV